MEKPSRQERLEAALIAVETLKEQSTIFDFQAEGDPPAKYIVTFRGKGIARSVSSASDVEIVELHRCEIRMSYSFPKRPPNIRWQTSIYHPNVSFSGSIRLKDIGLPWESDLGLDVICERLWDVARLAYVDMEHPANHSAKSWLAGHGDIARPADDRPLRDKLASTGSNVIHYERRAGGRVSRLSASGTDEILYIGEDTPTPELPKRGGWEDDDDVLYIGEE